MELLGYYGLTTCRGIFCGIMEEFIGVFFVFLDVQTTMIVEFYEIIHAMEKIQKIELSNVELKCGFALICVAFTVMTNVPSMFRDQ